ncbi:MAG: PQQ-dependent catabolism-associated beta-propeller protein [Alphaproteobacteria bacterium]|nr:PQQ-dependent catabolism-associated beta-propeller protein [Alphaproteobacteria bacterium]
MAAGKGTCLGLAAAGLLLGTQMARADCNTPMADAVTHVAVPGHPFSAVASADGCTIFVSLTAKDSHVLVLKRGEGAVTIAQNLPATGQVTGMALSPDGRFLAAANGGGVTLFDTARLIAGDDKAAMGYLNDRTGAGSIYAAFSPDQHLLFVSDERNAAITVHDFAGILAGKGAKPLGEIRTGDAPVGLAFSPDGRLLYSTSEAASAGGGCSENGGHSHGPGVLLVIDVAKAAVAPSDSVLARVTAGCSPVRVALSSDGARAYVSARGQNMLLAFDTARLINDSDHALVAQVPVGAAPVGVAAANGKVFVTNSNRFGGGDAQSVSVLDAGNLAAPQAAIPAGGFPRELKLTADGKTLLVTNYASGTLELVDMARLAEAAK